MPESLGMLEPGHGDVHDRRRSLHPRLRILCGDDGQAFRAGRGRTAARGRSGAADEVKARRHHRGRARRSEGRRRRIISRVRSARSVKWILRSSSKSWCRIFTRRIGVSRSCSTPRPDIYNHNMETVERLTPVVRSRAKYRTSLEVLRRAKELSPEIVTKSGVMLGLGETETELFQTMDDLREVGCEVLTMGQYLRPTSETFAGRRIHHTGAVQLLRRNRPQKGFLMSPPVRWSAARITRPISIRWCAGKQKRARNFGCRVRCPQRISYRYARRSALRTPTDREQAAHATASRLQCLSFRAKSNKLRTKF